MSPWPRAIAPARSEKTPTSVLTAAITGAVAQGMGTPLLRTVYIGGMKRQLLGVLLALVAAAALVASHASAKEGVVARVLTPIDRNASPGTKVTVVWTLSYVEGGKRHPFGGGDVFIRLFGPGEFRSRRISAAPVRLGRYRATVRVPRGGIRRVVIGLMGMRCAGVCRPAPMLFRIVGDPFR